MFIRPKSYVQLNRFIGLSLQVAQEMLGQPIISSALWKDWVLNSRDVEWLYVEFIMNSLQTTKPKQAYYAYFST